MKKIFLISSILVLFSCKKEPILIKPLSINQMKKILAELFICKGVATLYKTENSSIEDQLIEERVFKKNHITKKQFEKSHEYYVKNNKIYLDILIKTKYHIKELQSQLKK